MDNPHCISSNISMLHGETIKPIVDDDTLFQEQQSRSMKTKLSTNVDITVALGLSFPETILHTKKCKTWPFINAPVEVIAFRHSITHRFPLLGDTSKARKRPTPEWERKEAAFNLEYRDHNNSQHLRHESSSSSRLSLSHHKKWRTILHVDKRNATWLNASLEEES